MNKEDFERLKAVCEKEGFELSYDHERCETFNISKKDIWEGVEFAECLESYEGQFSIGKIYKITSGKTIGDPYFTIDDQGLSNGFGINESKRRFKPSTESAYIEQLKKEAHERFGEIKDGDRFDRTGVDKLWESIWYVSGTDFSYDKDIDRLYVGNVAIYQQGKWATRVKERVKVELVHETLSNNPTYQFKLTNWNETNRAKYSGQFLASQLEKYLNGEIE